MPSLNECALIARAAQKHNVPAAALCALRIAENGGPGREFGVLSLPAKTYEAQVDIAAKSFSNSEKRYRALGKDPIDAETGRYTEDFLRHFSARWAPIGALNDPANLNTHHAQNIIDAYGWFR
jgi:hypothetical protein